MSALPMNADMCGAMVHVCFGPIADIGRSILDIIGGDIFLATQEK
jgi:hypothetical protein